MLFRSRTTAPTRPAREGLSPLAAHTRMPFRLSCRVVEPPWRFTRTRQPLPESACGPSREARGERCRSLPQCQGGAIRSTSPTAYELTRIYCLHSFLIATTSHNVSRAPPPRFSVNGRTTHPSSHQSQLRLSPNLHVFIDLLSTAETQLLLLSTSRSLERPTPSPGSVLSQGANKGFGTCMSTLEIKYDSYLCFHNIG